MWDVGHLVWLPPSGGPAPRHSIFRCVGSKIERGNLGREGLTFIPSTSSSVASETPLPTALVGIPIPIPWHLVVIFSVASEVWVFKLSPKG